MKNKKIVKIIYSVLFVIVLVVTFYSLYSYLNQEVNKYKIINSIEEEVSLLEKTEEVKTLEYYKEYYSNNDVVGSLEIEGTNINTLLVQTTNNEYYLNHSLNKEYDIIGSIYVDYRVNLNSKQINIYGHNSQVYDVPFKELENYTDKDYYKEHKYIKIWDGETTNIYEIFSVQIVTSDYEYINVDSSDWSNHIKELNNSIYDTGLSATEEDDILVLQTCYYNPVNSFLIINSKKIV